MGSDGQTLNEHLGLRTPLRMPSQALRSGHVPRLWFAMSYTQMQPA